MATTSGSGGGLGGVLGGGLVVEVVGGVSFAPSLFTRAGLDAGAEPPPQE